MSMALASITLAPIPAFSDSYAQLATVLHGKVIKARIASRYQSVEVNYSMRDVLDRMKLIYCLGPSSLLARSSCLPACRGEGAEFRLDGTLQDSHDRKKAAAFVGRAINDRSLQESVTFIDSKGVGGVDLISSAMLDDELSALDDYTSDSGVSQ
ncbi:unnamed protein product [Sphagnum tenellum]